MAFRLLVLAGEAAHLTAAHRIRVLTRLSAVRCGAEASAAQSLCGWLESDAKASSVTMYLFS